MPYSVNLLPTFGTSHQSEWGTLRGVTFDSNNNMVLSSSSSYALAYYRLGVITPKQIRIKFSAGSKGACIGTVVHYANTGACGIAIECPLTVSNEIIVDIPSLELRDASSASSVSNIILQVASKIYEYDFPVTIPQIYAYLVY